MNPTKARLERKLNLIKLLSQKNQMSFDELEKYMGCTRKQLKKDLSQLFMAGTYPFTPADYIDIDCNGNFVSLSLPTKIEDAIGLTIYEWLAVRSAIEKKLEQKMGLQEEKILKQILEKIQKIIPSDITHNFANLRSEILKAINLRNQVEFYYKSREGKGVELRRVDPWKIFDEQTSYLIGYCHFHNGVRMFRLENMQDLKISNTAIQNSPNLEQIQNHIQSFYNFKKTAKSSSQEVELLIEPDAFYNFSSRMELQILEKEFFYKEQLFIKAKTKLINENWFLDRIRAYGSSVIVLKPKEIRERIHLEIVARLQALELS